MSEVLPLRLAPFEEYFLVDDRPGYRMTFAVELTFDGEMNRAAFEAGLTAALTRHPLLNALCERRRWNQWWWVSGESVRPAVDWGDHHCPILFPEDAGIDLTQELGVRFAVRVGGGRTRCVIQFHHSCCDGVGAIQFLSDLFAGYVRHLDPSAEKLPEFQPVDPRQLSRRNDLNVYHDQTMSWWTLFWKTLRYAWKYSVHSPAPLARPAATLHGGRPLAYPGTLTRTLPPSAQRALRQVARRCDVTVNELLVRELLLVIREWNQRHSSLSQHEHVSVLVPTNLRNLDHDGMPAANVMSYVAFQRPVADLNDPQELLLSIKEESQFYKRWRFGAAFLGGLRVVQQVPGFIRWICSRNRSVASAVLSCIGDPSMAIAANYPVDQNGDPVMGNLVMTDLNTAPPIRPLTHASFTTWHFSNKLRLGVRCDSNVFTHESAQELLDSFADRVLALAASATERQTTTRVAA